MYLISKPNAVDFLKEQGCPELENYLFKTMFYNHIKIIMKGSFQNEIIFYEVTLRLCTASESPTKTFDAPCMFNSIFSVPSKQHF